ncbi:MAG: cyclase family protein [Oscillospiraceae bacterium]|nr:cyclase family protein [Oscillospiraceae bacterium]MDD4413339.1 cyclase family protein [Oscillospiraceae bacterium]
MRIIDISRELMSAQVYPGDPAPEIKPLTRISLGDSCNTSALHICAHNATHLDVPLHFIPDGLDAESIELEACIGECSVVEFNGTLLGAQAEELMPFLHPRVLFKGEMELSPSAAFVLSTAGLRLVGVEEQAAALSECNGEVHKQLLGSGMLLLEGIDLSNVNPGSYFLFAAPIKIKGCDGSPVRAVLIER